MKTNAKMLLKISHDRFLPSHLLYTVQGHFQFISDAAKYLIHRAADVPVGKELAWEFVGSPLATEANVEEDCP